MPLGRVHRLRAATDGSGRHARTAERPPGVPVQSYHSYLHRVAYLYLPLPCSQNIVESQLGRDAGHPLGYMCRRPGRPAALACEFHRSQSGWRLDAIPEEPQVLQFLLHFSIIAVSEIVCSDYIDGEGSFLVTCLLHIDNSQHKQRSLSTYLSETSNVERTSTLCKKSIKMREDADRALVVTAKAAGNALFRQGRYLDAVVKYSEALSTFYGRQTAALWNNRSAAYMKAKMYQEALEDALKARGLKPDWAKVYFRIAVSSLHLGRFKLAADSVRMGLDLKPGDIELMCLRMKIQNDNSKTAGGLLNSSVSVAGDLDFLL